MKTARIRVVTLALLTGAACTSGTSIENLRDELATHNAPRREASLSPFLGEQVGDVPLVRYATQRSAWVIDGATSLELVNGDEPGAKVYRGVANGKVVTAEFGAAAAITDDGYFLTAAHCVSTGRALVVGVPKGRPARQSDSVVVWNGATATPPIDLAVLWVPDLVLPAFALAVPAAPAVGDPVLCAGSGGRGLVVAGGRVIDHHAATQSITIDVPLLPGDSGGPCVLANGALVGIVSTAMVTAGAPRGTVLVPDREWLGALLEQHRSTRESGPRPTGSASLAGVLRASGLEADLARVLGDARR